MLASGSVKFCAALDEETDDEEAVPAAAAAPEAEEKEVDEPAAPPEVTKVVEVDAEERRRMEIGVGLVETVVPQMDWIDWRKYAIRSDTVTSTSIAAPPPPPDTAKGNDAAEAAASCFDSPAAPAPVPAPAAARAEVVAAEEEETEVGGPSTMCTAPFTANSAVEAATASSNDLDVEPGEAGEVLATAAAAAPPPPAAADDLPGEPIVPAAPPPPLLPPLPAPAGALWERCAIRKGARVWSLRWSFSSRVTLRLNTMKLESSGLLATNGICENRKA